MKRAVKLFGIFLLGVATIGVVEGLHAVRLARANQPADKDLSGIWQLAGEEGGKAYHGVLLLELQDDETYAFTSQTPSGAPTHGIGIRKGDALSVGWVQSHGDKLMIGVTVYTISRDGKHLEGEWRTVGGGKSPRRERAKWLAKLKPSEI